MPSDDFGSKPKRSFPYRHPCRFATSTSSGTSSSRSERQRCFPTSERRWPPWRPSCSVPAAPLPLLRPGDVALGIEEPAAPQVPDGVAMQGTVEITGEDGTTKQVLEFFYDADTGEIVRLGDDDVSPEVHALLDSWAEIGPLQEMTAEWLVRNHGEEYAREVAEKIRATEGEAAGEAAMAEIDEAVQTLAMEAAATNLGEALEALHTTIAATKERVDSPVSEKGIDERDALTALLTAAERVMYELDEFRTTATG